MAAELVKRLASAMVSIPGTDNASTNAKLWDQYSASWARAAATGQADPWLASMAGRVGLDASALSRTELGCEWADAESFETVFQEYVAEPLAALRAARPGQPLRGLEIGSGGGRVATRLAPLVDSLVCADISAGMLRECRAAVERRCEPAVSRRVRYVQLALSEAVAGGVDFAALNTEVQRRDADAAAPVAAGGGASAEGEPAAAVPAGSFDFVVCFDVLVHCDLHVLWAYLQRVRALLAPWGRAFVSTANLCSPLGWARFAAQRTASAAGFCFTSPEAVDYMVQRAGLAALRRSWPLPLSAADGDGAAGAGRMYHHRDYLLLLGCAAGAAAAGLEACGSAAKRGAEGRSPAAAPAPAPAAPAAAAPHAALPPVTLELPPEGVALKHATLVLLHDEAASPPRVLLAMKKRGFGAGKLNGCGGKVEPGETLLACALREAREEVGVTPAAAAHVGTLVFTFEKEDGAPIPEELRVYVFRARGIAEGEVAESEEMAPVWVPCGEVPYDRMWQDDRIWVPHLLAGRSFRGRFHFRGLGAIVRHALEVLDVPPGTPSPEWLRSALGVDASADILVSEKQGSFLAQAASADASSAASPAVAAVAPGGAAPSPAIGADGIELRTPLPGVS